MTSKRETERDARGRAAIELFLDMIASERGASRNTIEAYRCDLDDYAAFLAAKGSGVASASTDDVRAYLAALVKRGMAANSSARKLSAIRQLHRFLYAEGKRKDDPAAVLEGPRRGRALPKVLSIEEVSRLFEAARDAAKKAGEHRAE
ncbi:MAG TPA: site-specific integrase, partial [Xanthobacteraceae bacterium]|nr:site-specific integrase [Xanthobacteraceae bacterium]